MNLQAHYDLKVARRNLKPEDAKWIKSRAAWEWQYGSERSSALAADAPAASDSWWNGRGSANQQTRPELQNEANWASHPSWPRAT